MFITLLLISFFLPLSPCCASAPLAFSIATVQYPFPDVVIATDAMPHHWAFYFQGSGGPITCYGTWSTFLHKVHITLQELWAVALMLGKKTFGYSLSLLPYIWTTLLLKLIYVIKVIPILFLSRLAFLISNLADRNGITLNPAYISSHPNVEADSFSQGQLVPKCHLLPGMVQAAFHLWGLSVVNLLVPSHIKQYQHYYTLQSPLPLETLGFECYQPSLYISGELCVKVHNMYVCCLF